MSIPGHDLPLGQRCLNIGLELLLGGGLGPHLSDQLVEPSHDFLVGQTMQGACQAIEASGEREVGIGEGRANQVGGVS